MGNPQVKTRLPDGFAEQVATAIGEVCHGQRSFQAWEIQMLGAPGVIDLHVAVFSLEAWTRMKEALVLAYGSPQ